MSNNIQLFFVIVFNVVLAIKAEGQLSAFVKSGLNMGYVNQDYWMEGPDLKVKLTEPLLRPVFGLGIQHSSKNWIIRQEAFYQVKGQGTPHPVVRTFFTTSNPDILRFMSFPFSIHRRIISSLYIGIGYQPSLYLSGKDNYTYGYKTRWRGWTHTVAPNIHGVINQSIEVGLEYDPDFSGFRCAGCEERFHAIRVYGMYHFNK